MLPGASSVAAEVVGGEEEVQQRGRKKSLQEEEQEEEQLDLPEEILTSAAQQGAGPHQVLLQRLHLLHSAVAALELQQQRLDKENRRLQHRNDKLKQDRKSVRHTVRQMEEERCRLEQQLKDRGTPQGPGDSAEEQQQRSRVHHLEEQVTQLALLLAEEQQRRTSFVQQWSRNGQWLLSLREQLSHSLLAVTRRPIAAVLESEALRLDQSLREEELRTSLGQS